MLACELGFPITIDEKDQSFELESNDGSQTVSIPIVSFGKEQIQKRSGGFMREFGLSFLLQVDIDENDHFYDEEGT